MIEDKELGLKFGTEEEKFWTDIKDKTEAEIKTLKKMLKFNEEILNMTLNKLKELDL